jgi:hypothetical protein
MASTTNTEKALSARRPNIPTSELGLDEIGETKGYIVGDSLASDNSLVEGLKFARDGHTVLILHPSVEISSYNVYCYPEGSGEVGAWLNQSRTLGGFVISYLQVR